MLFRRLAIFCFLFLHTINAFATKAIVLLGPPGSGKGTQGELLSQAISLPVLGFGTLLRGERLKNSDIYERYVRLHQEPNGRRTFQLEFLLNGVENGTYKNGLILDSWPRSKESLQALIDNFFQDDEPLVFELVVSPQTLLSRAVDRIVCPNPDCGSSYGATRTPEHEGVCDRCQTSLFKRKKDNIDDFPHRVESYFRKREQIKQAYSDQGIAIHAIEADRDPQVVHEEIMAYVREYL